MRFTSAYMVPTGSPFRASLMTAKYTSRTGICAGTPWKLQKVKGKKSKRFLTLDGTTT